jgi:hypothetical protein
VEMLFERPYRDMSVDLWGTAATAIGETISY